ncbi:MAG: 6-phosphofructokinase [Clostridiales bacterium]|nr:6-phosphofructokinase [Clostridiales bacterium]
MKKIAVLTSGGDAPGMNAAIRAAVRYGINEGMEVFGIERGYAGLIENVFLPMNMRTVSDIVQRGGTLLRTARSAEFLTDEGQELAVKFLHKRGIDGVIVIGGDGSFRGAEALSKRGIPTVGIPGTIDNDLAYTDFTLGFDTACNTVLDAINKLRDTMSSHDRICIIEVMGRGCGDIALHAGLGGGAEIVLVPEVPMTYLEILDRLNEDRSKGKFSSIIVVAEGVCKAEELQRKIKDSLGAAVRATVLGHLQRGGSPSARDRYLGTCWGVQAVKLLKEGKGNRVVGIKDNRFIDMEIDKAMKMKKEFDYELYDLANVVSNSAISYIH